MLSARKEAIATENKPAWAIAHEIGIANDDGEINTHKYEVAVHIVFEGMNADFVVVLCFTQVKRPHRIGVAIEIADHVRCFGGNWLSGVVRSSSITRLSIFAYMLPIR
jgi:hypothetical protein